MRIVTAYTPDYEPLAQRLIASCDQFGVPFFAVPFESKGDWISNNNFKPNAILTAMRETGEDVCWLDADMYLHAPMPDFPRAHVWVHRTVQPIVFDFERRCIVPNVDKLPVPWGGHCAFACSKSFAHRRVVEILLSHWAALCEQYTPDTNDEQCLMHALQKFPVPVAPFPLHPPWLTHTPAGHTHGKPQAWNNL